MGTVFTKSEGEINIITEDVIATIKSAAQKIDTEHGDLHCTWYLFGSLLQGSVIPSDIDLAVICSNQKDVQIVRIALDELLSELPTAHITLMCEEEEKEFGFIARACAQQIHPSPSKKERQIPETANSL